MRCCSGMEEDVARSAITMIAKTIGHIGTTGNQILLTWRG